MYKSYTIKAFKFKEISSGKGTVTYYLVDELGDERKVTAKAKSGFIKKIKSVEAIHHRETPLVEALANASINDTISIDFSSFNRKFPRLHANSRTEKLARGTMQTINNGQRLASMDTLNVDGFRLLQLFSVASVCVMVYMVGMEFLR